MAGLEILTKLPNENIGRKFALGQSSATTAVSCPLVYP